MDFRDSIPGYWEAVAKEQILRDAAFLGLTESIADGFEAVPLTMRHYLSLRAIRSPFLVGGTVAVSDVIAFLRVVAPENSNWIRFGELCASFEAKLPWLHTFGAMARWRIRAARAEKRLREVTLGIIRYLDAALNDCGGGGAASAESYFSDGAAMVHRFGLAYGWSRERTMSEPLKCLFQYLKAIKAEDFAKAGRLPVLHNPSGRIISDWLAEHQPPDSVAAKLAKQN